MEQIKDMVTLRAFAYDQAMRHGAGATMTLNIAKDIENYILGDAKLSEVCDHDAHLKEFSKILRENTSRPSFSMSWISPNNEMRPPYNTDIVVRIMGSSDFYIGRYTKECGWDIKNAPFNRTIVAWLPIPKYDGSTL